MKYKFEGENLVAVHVTKENVNKIADELMVGKRARSIILLEEYAKPGDKIYLVADWTTTPPRWRATVEWVFRNKFEFVEPEEPNTLKKVKVIQ
ncbi:hypothetical protein PQB78_gp28 [Arthrobacter phage Xenomorph]|uniref:Uncharacterized protein n=1 Tax=Arthrobacter phage Xenomorph TaxID=2591069 RepID=A0A514A3X3_9CAUD|nr:hypothetical protein PQB78_gp28 [Arthrobacter phage Xenomorph]QDH47941.1 hypothetical protein SEA_XENOMORPH_28 [Arthrobacter phage Xenomorph]